jgi:hypothetical protein
MFEKGGKNKQAEYLKNVLKAKVFGMVMMNRQRVNYAEMLQKMINE